MIEMIKRNYPAEFRAEENNDGVVVGVPIVYDTPTDIGGWFQETIVKGALSDEELKSDVRFFWNHNIDEKALARSIIPLNKNGGMELKASNKGVDITARLNLKRTDANDLYLAIQDGTVNAMSFMFGVQEERWEDLDTDYPKRFITKISPLIEVSAVNFPAYEQTSIGVRSNLSTENDKCVLEKARSQFLNKRNAENITNNEELELLKIKNKNLGGR